MIDLATLDRLIDQARAAAIPDDCWPAMKHQMDLVISQRPHQRRLRKCQYRRILQRRKRERR